MLMRPGQVALMLETHVKELYAERVIKKCNESGWDATISVAAQSAKSDSGSNGGALALARKGRGNRPICTCLDADGKRGRHNDLGGRVTLLGNSEVIVLGAYFTCGLGLRGQNLDLLSEIEYVTRTGRSPFILGADFNMTPDEWEAELADWMKKMKVSVVLPSNSSYTCKGTKTKEGSLIDFFLVSHEIAPWVKKVQC